MEEVSSRMVHSQSGYSLSSSATGPFCPFLIFRFNGVPTKHEDFTVFPDGVALVALVGAFGVAALRTVLEEDMSLRVIGLNICNCVGSYL